MEIICRRRAVCDLNIVFGAQLQEAFKPRGAVFRTLSFIAMRQQHHEAIGAQPFRFTGGNKLIDHGLRTIHEVAKLRFPKHQCLGFGTRIAIFKTQHAEFR